MDIMKKGKKEVENMKKYEKVEKIIELEEEEQAIFNLQLEYMNIKKSKNWNENWGTIDATNE